MRVLITGAGGQLGTDLAISFDGHDVIAFSHSELDVGDLDSCLQISEAEPEVIVHAAAYTDVDGCEADPDRAWRDNVTGSHNVAVAAKACKAFLIAISSDYVFDGTATKPYDEDTSPSPLGVYGKSKAAGERAAMEANPDATAIVRSSWIYGASGRNFVKTMLRLAADRQTLDVVDDQTGSPTWSLDLARALIRIASSRRPGVWHATNAGATTWFGFARKIFELSGLDPARVRPTTTAAFARPAPRPAYSVLGDRVWRQAGFPPMRPWEEALREALPSISP